MCKQTPVGGPNTEAAKPKHTIMITKIGLV